MFFFKKILHGTEAWKKTLVRDMFTLAYRDSTLDRGCEPVMNEICLDIGVSESTVIKVLKNLDTIPEKYPTDKWDKRYYLRCLVRVSLAGNKKDVDSMKKTIFFAEKIGMTKKDVARDVDYYS